MAKKISELNPLTVAIDNNGLFEFAQSAASWKITAAQLLNYISYLGSATQRISLDGTSDVTIEIEHIIGLYYADFVPNGTPAWQEGRVFWNADDHTFSVYNDVEGVVLQVGQETYLRVRNNTGSQINNGQVVYVSGATGQAAEISLAQADNHDTCKNLAMATHNIGDGQFGYVTVRGLVRGVNTSVFSEGDFLYLSPSVPGGLTTSKPTAPSQVAFVGTVIIDGVNGSILVNPTHHGGLDELSDVSYEGIGSGAVLFYDGLAGYWRPTTLFEIDSTASLLTLNGDLDVTGHSAFGNTAELDTAGSPTYGVVMRIQESTGAWSGAITGLNVALTNTVVGDFASTLGAVIQATGQSSQTGSVTGAVITGSGGTTPDADNIIGVDASAGSAADNSTVALVVGMDASTSAGFGHVNATVTTMAGGQFQLLEYGSGDISISNAYGILIKTPGFDPTGTITNLYGLYISDQSGITAAGSSYNLYSAGANAQNHIEGNLTVSSDLTVDGTINAVAIDSTSIVTDLLRFDDGESWIKVINGSMHFHTEGIPFIFTADDNSDAGVEVFKIDNAATAYFPLGLLYLGTQGTSYYGQIRLQGSDSNQAGQITFYTADSASIINNYVIEVVGENFRINPNLDGDALVFNGATEQWRFGSAGGVFIGAVDGTSELIVNGAITCHDLYTQGNSIYVGVGGVISAGANSLTVASAGGVAQATFDDAVNSGSVSIVGSNDLAFEMNTTNTGDDAIAIGDLNIWDKFIWFDTGSGTFEVYMGDGSNSFLSVADTGAAHLGDPTGHHVDVNASGYVDLVVSNVTRIRANEFGATIYADDSTSQPIALTIDGGDLELKQTDDTPAKFYMGDKDLNLNWRFVATSNSLVIQQRQAGNWVTKHTISGA